MEVVAVKSIKTFCLSIPKECSMSNDWHTISKNKTNTNIEHRIEETKISHGSWHGIGIRVQASMHEVGGTKKAKI